LHEFLFKNLVLLLSHEESTKLNTTRAKMLLILSKYFVSLKEKLFFSKLLKVVAEYFR